ncbi:MAG: biosynthetic peptidoglycan transglycosylase, partial [Bacteroidales bacterium]
MQKKANFWRYVAGVTFILILMWIGHQLVFKWAVRKAVTQLENRWQLEVTLGSYRTVGITGANFKNILIEYASGDTLFWANDIYLRLKFFPLWIGKVQLAQLQMDSLMVSYRPYLLRQIDTGSLVATEKGERGAISYRLRALFKRLPNTMDVASGMFCYSDSSQWFCARIDSFVMAKKQVSGRLHLSDAQMANAFSFWGTCIPQQYLLDITLQSLQRDGTPLPYVMQKWNMALSLSRVHFECRLPNAATILLTASAGPFSVFHPKIAEQSVQLDTSFISLQIKTEKTYWQIDSTSLIGFNGFSFPLFVHYQYDTLNPILTFAIPAINFPAQQFFDALPQGAFRHVSGLKADGNLSFVLRGRIPFGQLDSLNLYSQLRPHNFRIRQFGMAYLPMLNDTFTLHRCEPGLPPITIKVDSTARSYTHLRDISKYLIAAVLTSEDGSFFYHKGFNEEAFAKSLAENIRKKRFARGASTISMQLVRNVFLSRKKTLSRKFEEILLTWLLENSNIVSKERMLEIYFNIIEWGPNIYGIR